MTVCDWTLLNELWDALGTWADGDSQNSESSISPAGQLYLDCRALTVNGARANRSKDIGTIGAGDYTVYMRFKGDVWDGLQSTNQDGIKLFIQAGTNAFLLLIANQADGSTDGIWVFNGAAYVKVVTKTWDNGWHTIRLDIHNSQTDMDIYIDDEISPSATDADITFATTTDGVINIYGYGTIAGNGEYHIDYLKINAGLCTPPVNYIKDLFETITITDSLAKLLKRSFAETITLTDAIAKVQAHVRGFLETITITDLIAKKASKVYKETITIVDTLAKKLNRTFSEVITLTDAITKAKIAIKDFTETITITDLIAKVVTYARSLTETITITDSISKTLGKVYKETITIVDTISKIPKKVLAETITITDKIRRYLNGLLVSIWGKIEKPTTLFSKRAKPTTTFTKTEKPTGIWTKREKPEA